MNETLKRLAVNKSTSQEVIDLVHILVQPGPENETEIFEPDANYFSLKNKQEKKEGDK